MCWFQIGGGVAYKYVLEQKILNPHFKMEIDEERFNRLATAKSVLSDALAFEQGYEVLLGNYADMELVFAKIGLQSRLEWDYEYSAMARAMRDANRYLINVLTAMRGYVDQILQLFKILDSPRSFKDLAENYFKEMHASSSDYRFIYELRNHVQHQGDAIQSFQSVSQAGGDSSDWAESVILYALKRELAKGRFKRKILDEQPDKIDVRHCVRMSILALAAVHLDLRSKLAEHVDMARANFNEAIADCLAAGAGGKAALAARRVGDEQADIAVFLGWDDVRLELVNKNRYLPRLWSKPARFPTAKDIAELRGKAEQTIDEAARMTFVHPTRWAQWEAGLPMPRGLFQFYQLCLGEHPDYEITPIKK